MLIEEEMTMSEVALHDYKLIPVISRLGIKMGYGDKTIRQLCDRKNISVRFVLTILNAFHDPDYFPAEEDVRFSARSLVEYLRKAHAEYLNEKIPEIELLITQMTSACDIDYETHNLFLNFFEEYKNELNSHMEREELTVYPYVIQLEQAVEGGKISRELVRQMNEYPISAFEKEHENVEEKLMDLKNLMIKYLPELKDDKHCFGILRELISFEKELAEHARIENMILIPKVGKYEELLKQKTGGHG